MGPTRRASPTSRWPRPGPDSSPNLDLNPNLTRTLTRTLTLTLTQSLTIAHLKVAVTHPGIFCAFSSPEVEDTCSVRLYVMIAPHLTSLQPYPTSLHPYPTILQPYSTR